MQQQAYYQQNGFEDPMRNNTPGNFNQQQHPGSAGMYYPTQMSNSSGHPNNIPMMMSAQGVMVPVPS